MRGEAKGKKAYWQKGLERGPGSNFASGSAQIEKNMSAIKDYLEELMDLKRDCTIRFRSVDGGVSTTKGHIVKIETVSHRDMIETDSGLLIGADQILEINGRSFENIC